MRATVEPTLVHVHGRAGKLAPSVPTDAAVEKVRRDSGGFRLETVTVAA
jgi:hypothetical protein